MMKIAVMADIHGNHAALEAVLADLAGQGPIDRLIFAGDFFAPGPAPNAVLASLQAWPQARFTRGNADRYLLEGTYATVYGPDGWQGELRRAFRWGAEQLGEAGYRFLASLPFSQVIQIGESQILVVHGSPRSDEEGLTMETRPEELATLGLDPQVALLACGHTHIPMDRSIDGVRVVNVGSVGLPFDGDPRASYALISAPSLPAGRKAGPGPNAFQVELRRVVYDVEEAVAQLYAANHPAAALSAYNLRTGRPRGEGFSYLLAEQSLESQNVR